MHICIVSPSFPTKKTIDFVFVEQLCNALADIGHRITVIAPQSITKCWMRGIPVEKRHYRYTTAKDCEVEVYRPYYISLGGGRLKNLFHGSFNRAVRRAFRRIDEKPDICYGHFWQSGLAIYPCAKANTIPLFVASGEENVAIYVNASDNLVKDMTLYLSGVINVSSKNHDECLSLNLCTSDNSVIIPNAIDNSLFFKKNKQQLRDKLQIQPCEFVVSFVGQFVSRKGILRLNEALKQIGDNRIKAIFMGRGNDDPDYDGIIYKGTVPHNKLPDYLNSADIFVLPTENEGCSNAIIEAMACGLPVISTDAAFNYDILNDSNSILIDCHNVNQIKDAIIRLKEDESLRMKMSDAAVETASKLTLNKRAERIVDFIKERGDNGLLIKYS